MYGAKVKLLCAQVSTAPDSWSSIKQALASAVEIGTSYVLIPETTLTISQVSNLLSSNVPLVNGTSPNATNIANIAAQINEFFGVTIFLTSTYSDAIHNACFGIFPNTQNITSEIPLSSDKYTIFFVDSGGDYLFYAGVHYYSGNSYPYSANNWIGFYSKTNERIYGYNKNGIFMAHEYYSGGRYVAIRPAVKCSDGIASFRISRDYNESVLTYHNTYSTWPTSVTGDFFDKFKSNYHIPTDPYAEVPTSGTGGGNKPYDPFATDNVDYELLPEVSAVGTGFISLWCPTEQQMLNLSAYMWNADVLTLDFWRKLVADPIQLVYGLNIIPLDLRTIGIVGQTPDTVVVGAISTGIKMDYLTSQWVELDCGTIDIDESMLGSYLDYDPFTKVDIYLPYIGYRPLRVDDIMPGTIQLKYRVDLLTGACVAQIKSTKSNEHDDTLDSIIYQYMGNCATQIPVTASQYADAVRSAITTAAAVGTIAVLAGTGAGAGVAAAGAEIMPGTQPAGLLSGPGMVPVDSELGAGMARYSQMTSAPSVAESGGGASTLKQAGIIHSAASAGGNVMGIKPSIERSGAIGGAAGMLATQMPYLVFTRPRLAHPEDQHKYTGYPAFMTRTLSELSGFTQIQAIHLEGIPCTANELAEIDALLKSGVIF